jgi:hypothetical protein
MILNIFDLCFSNEGQYPENRLYCILVSSIIFYVTLFIFIKNMIYYGYFNDLFYWCLLILLMIDLTMFINKNRDIIDTYILKTNIYIQNICEYCNKKNKSITQLNKNNNIEIKENNELEKGLIDDEQDYTRVII